MEAQLEQIREQQKASWNKFSPGWKKWDELTMDFLKPAADEIIRMINPKDGELILDVAAGTGEPGLTIAQLIPNGKVVITDLAEGMIDVARESAERRGITNVETIACDVSNMPFDNDTFDAISCRFGFMFFPDMLLAAKEMVRVLKPGGRIAASIWNGPEKNPWITTTLSIVNKNLEVPPPPPDAPGLFRCAKEGFIADLFRQAGLKNISEKEAKGKFTTATVDVYWSFMSEVVAPVAAGLSKADDAMKAKIKNEVIDVVNRKYPDGKIAIDASSQVIYGEK